jgi:HSP20 family protein
MPVRDLIPWGRESVPAPARGEQNPFLAFHREINRVFDDFFRGFDRPLSLLGPGSGWPQVDVTETDKEYRVTAELPGLEDKDVELSLSDDILTLKGEKKIEHGGGGSHYSERFHGQFQRSIELGGGIDRDKVTASFKNGLLTVVLPKSAEAREQAKRIPINTK